MVFVSNCLIFIGQGVTLGGTGKDSGDRHPKIQEGVLIGAGATILGNIVVGRGAMVAAGSLVLKDVPAHRSSLRCCQDI
jgi:serine O-acetyltransferase